MAYSSVFNFESSWITRKMLNLVWCNYRVNMDLVLNYWSWCICVSLSLYFSQFWCCKFVRVLNAIFHTDQIEWDFRKPQISRLEMFRVNGKVPCNTHKSILTNQSDWPCLQLIHSSWCLLVTVVAFIIRERILREHTRAHRHADVLTHTQLG